jgi:hypothetical protein
MCSASGARIAQQRQVSRALRSTGACGRLPARLQVVVQRAPAIGGGEVGVGLGKGQQLDQAGV